MQRFQRNTGWELVCVRRHLIGCRGMAWRRIEAERTRSQGNLSGELYSLQQVNQSTDRMTERCAPVCRRNHSDAIEGEKIRFLSESADQWKQVASSRKKPLERANVFGREISWQVASWVQADRDSPHHATSSSPWWMETEAKSVWMPVNQV